MKKTTYQYQIKNKTRSQINPTPNLKQLWGSALRRPGRFDREFLFGLPSKASRRAILDIHTSKWLPPLDPHIKNEIAEQAVGYCGSDLKVFTYLIPLLFFFLSFFLPILSYY